VTGIYDFTAKSLTGRDIPLSSYRDKVLLIVNTASKCGFTPQYEGLEKLHADYEARGFAVLGFPCNQFLGQEPGNSEQIGKFCRLDYFITFPMFEKIHVNGAEAHPLYEWLKEQAPGILGSKSVKWNFTKFLIDRKGNVESRYTPMTPPENIRPTIERLLGRPA
jgi:glutathione peroxidase